MKVTRLLLVLVLAGCPAVQGDTERVLEREEVLRLLQELTGQPRKTWIEAGTIEAVHHEYAAATTTDRAAIAGAIEKALAEYRRRSDKRELTETLQRMLLDAIPFNVRYRLANEYTMSSRVVVRYDGERFYWEIDVDSRQDSVQPEASLAGNFMMEWFEPAWNGRRIFAWNGRKYVTYSVSGGHAIVDAAGKLPRAMHGPLTAGLIPWGYGKYAYDRLIAGEVTAAEANIGGRTRIEVTITHADGSSTTATLDPAQGYAVTGAVLAGRNHEAVHYTCSAYQLIGSRWVPFNICIDRYDGPTNRLLRSEQWLFTVADDSRPAPDGFDVTYDPGTRVETFEPEGSEGTALPSDQPFPGGSAAVADNRRKDHVVTSGWACTLLLQEEGWEPCEMVGGDCQGIYRYYWERYGCERAGSGTCTEMSLVRFQDSPCLDDPVYGCTVAGEWEYCTMQACR